jgi:hypothetical protein
MKQLLGGWRPESWSFVCQDGRAEFPMGSDARGDASARRAQRIIWRRAGPAAR